MPTYEDLGLGRRSAWTRDARPRARVRAGDGPGGPDRRLHRARRLRRAQPHRRDRPDRCSSAPSPACSGSTSRLPRPRAARDRRCCSDSDCCSAWPSGRCSATTPRPSPRSLWQAAGATALFVGALGAYGYATRRDLSSWARTLFWALLALIVFGLVAAVRRDPARAHHLRGARPGDLRRVHDLRLQPPAPGEHGQRGADRRRHLPRHLQRVPVHAVAVRRGRRPALGSRPARWPALRPCRP